MRRLTVLLVVLFGCPDLERPAEFPALDAAAFRCEVEPVLAARCAFSDCHGTPVRPFRVYARNRLRLNPTSGEYGYWLSTPLTIEENRANFDMARGFATSRDVGLPLLLGKPLDVAAGGLFHLGKTLYGNRDAFDSPDDPGYRRIADWIGGKSAPADCTPVEEVAP